MYGQAISLLQRDLRHAHLERDAAARDAQRAHDEHVTAAARQGEWERRIVSVTKAITTLESHDSEVTT